MESPRFRTNGYYYHEYEVTDYLADRPNNTGGRTVIDESEYKRKYVEVVIPYINGYIYYGNWSITGIEKNVTNQKELNILNQYPNVLSSFEEAIKTNKYLFRKTGRRSDIWNWGIFYLKNDSVSIQYYENVSGNYFLNELKGIIENDTTIIILKEKEYKNHLSKGYEKRINEVFHFRKLINKPDSSNYIMMNRHRFGN